MVSKEFRLCLLVQYSSEEPKHIFRGAFLHSKKVCVKWKRLENEKDNEFQYGLLFQAWDFDRSSEPPLPLSSQIAKGEDEVVNTKRSSDFVEVICIFRWLPGNSWCLVTKSLASSKADLWNNLFFFLFIDWDFVFCLLFPARWKETSSSCSLLVLIVALVLQV